MSIENGQFPLDIPAESEPVLRQTGRVKSAIGFLTGGHTFKPVKERLTEVRAKIDTIISATEYNYLKTAAWFNNLNFALRVNEAAHFFLARSQRKAMIGLAGTLCIAALLGVSPMVKTARAMEAGASYFSLITAHNDTSSGFQPVVSLDDGGGSLWDKVKEGFTNQNNQKMISEEDRKRAEKTDERVCNGIKVVTAGGLVYGALKLYKSRKNPRKKNT